MNQKVIIITVVGILVLIGLILVLKQSISPEFNDTELVYDDALPGSAPSFNSGVEVAQSEAIFLQQIQQLQNITFAESAILQDPGFQRLEDNTVTLRTARPGRLNPFEPIDLRLNLQQLDIAPEPVVSRPGPLLDSNPDIGQSDSADVDGDDLNFDELIDPDQGQSDSAL